MKVLWAVWGMGVLVVAALAVCQHARDPQRPGAASVSPTPNKAARPGLDASEASESGTSPALIDAQIRMGAGAAAGQAAKQAPTIKITKACDTDLDITKEKDLPRDQVLISLDPLDKPITILVEGPLQTKTKLTATAKKGAVGFDATPVDVDDATAKAKQAQLKFSLDDFVKAGGGTYTITASVDTVAQDSVAIKLQPKSDSPHIGSVAENGYPWKTLSFPKLLLGQVPITVNVSGVRENQTVAIVQTDKKELDNVTKPTVKKGETTAQAIINTLSATGVLLAARADVGWSSSLTTDQIQAPSADVKDPTITDFFNGKYAKAQTFSSSTTVNVYDGYLHLKGKRGPTNGSVRFVVQNEGDSTGAGKGLHELPESAKLSDGGDWDAVLDLTALNLNSTTQHKLWVRAEEKGKHIYSASFLKFQAASGSTLLTPSIAAVVPASQPDVSKAAFITSAATVTLTVNLDSSVPDAQVLVFDEADATSSAPVATEAVASSTVNVKIDKLAPGKHRFTAALARGSKVGAKSAPVDLLVKRGGLRVESVRPTNLGTTPGERAITVQFTAANRLNKTQAEKATSYRVRRSNGSGSFDLGTDTNVPTPFADPGGITFDDTNNSVLLHASSTELFVDLYQLGGRQSRPLSGLIKPDQATGDGIQDIFGNALEDANGVQGKNYKIVLGKPAAATAAPAAADGSDVPSEKRGISGQTGPYVVFPEYTPPRAPVDGVNPSDRVETRVVRLYYFRDAHRVAQIVNRDVKSYNYQAVEIARRLADKARDTANKLTDDRRAQERKAVQAAQETREAQAKVVQAQNALAQARQSGNQASAVAQNLDSQLLPAQNNLDLANANLQAAQNAQKDLLDKQKTLQEELTRQQAAVPQDAAATAKAQDAVKQGQAAIEKANADVRGAQATASAADIRVKTMQQQKGTAQANLTAETANLTTAEAMVRSALAEVQAKRTAEVAANESALSITAQEDRSREDQFRREVAAAHEDPDTYAPGIIKSEDPVQKCSISVIGEGIIQLRGPVKGMNVIRTMINQMDAPVGQVRVAIHTAQVNGEHQDRMEKVVGRIHKYIDHSRFLTAQSAQMLKKAVTLVASRKAEQAYLASPPGSQAARDQKYLYAFFGQDFIQELETLDSEFLKTGNKLLSLHSMDSTSLSSALFLLALAKNTTRYEILAEFARLTSVDLPAAEMAYFEAAGPEKRLQEIPTDGRQRLVSSQAARLLRRRRQRRRHHDAHPARVRALGPNLQEPASHGIGAETKSFRAYDY